MLKIFLVLMLLLPGLVRAADQGLVLKIMVCESGLRHNVWGDDGKSYGIAQFRKETFYEFAAMAKKEMRAAKFYKPNWFNPQHQVFLLNWGLDHGYGRRWTCFRTLSAQLNMALLPQLASPPASPSKAQLFRELADLQVHRVVAPLWFAVEHPNAVISKGSRVPLFVGIVVLGGATPLPSNFRTRITKASNSVSLVLLRVAAVGVVDKQADTRSLARSYVLDG
jgi:hypothetical protein